MPEVVLSGQDRYDYIQRKTASGMTLKQIAEKLDISYDYLRVWLFRNKDKYASTLVTVPAKRNIVIKVNRNDSSSLNISSTAQQSQLLKKRLIDLTPEQLARRSLPLLEWGEYYLKDDFRIKVHIKKAWDKLQELRGMGVRKFLNLWPRDHGKTTLFSFVEPVYDLCNYPFLAQMLVNETAEVAEDNVARIKNVLLYNDRIEEDYGKIIDPEQINHKYKINVMDKPNRREANLQGLGIGSRSVAGWHGEKIKLDDVVQDDDPNNKTVKKKKCRWFNSIIVPTLRFNDVERTDVELNIIGTRKDPDDFYQFIIDKKTYYPLVYKAIYQYPERSELIEEYIADDYGDGGYTVITGIRVFGDYQILAPDMHTIEELLLKKHDMGTIAWEREMQNNPINPEGYVFKRDWLKYVPHGEVLKKIKHMKIYAAVDPASGLTADSDLFSISTVGYYERKYFLINLVAGHFSFHRMIDLIWENQKTIEELGGKVLKLAVESNFYQSWLAREAERVYNLNIKEYKQTKSKEMRIESLTVFFEKDEIRIDESLPHRDKFEAEFLNFPNVHPDIMDSLEMAIALVPRYTEAIWR